MTRCGVSAIVLAAGLSSRMGKLKALLPWQGIPLINYQIEQMQKAKIDDIIIVLGHEAHKLEKVIGQYNVKKVFNEHYDQGKSSSVSKGVAHINQDTEGILISAVDQPVPGYMLENMIQHLRTTKAKGVIPIYQGKRGHPILFHESVKYDLLAVNEETKGLRNVIKKHYNQIAQLAVNDPAILLNFNKPNDYKKVCQGAYNESFRN